MPNERQTRRGRVRREPQRPQMRSFVDCFLREVAPLLRRSKRPRSRSERHLRNAAIEVLEAMRALLDEGITWLRSERGQPEMRRIRVEE